jgi:hypothetical protein
MMGRRPKPDIREYFPFPGGTPTSSGFFGGGGPFGGLGGAGGPGGLSGLGGSGGFGGFSGGGGSNWFASAGANLDQMIATFGKVQKLMGMIRQMSPMMEMLNTLTGGQAVTASRESGQAGAVRGYASASPYATNANRVRRRTPRRAKPTRKGR